MPSRTDSVVTRVHAYDSASALPAEVMNALFANPRNTNVVLPHVLKSREREQLGQSTPDGQCWITCTTYKPRPNVEFVLACTESDMGKYPIFIVTTLPLSSLSPAFLEPRIALMIEHLLAFVNVERVYSVFAPDAITAAFVDEWTSRTGVEPLDEAYYAAKLTFCTSMPLARSMTKHTEFDYELRPAVWDDLGAVAELCEKFSQESEPFVLTSARAVREAQLLIQNRQVWVHTIDRKNGSPIEVASIVAFTRNTNVSATITKVYTNKRWRGRGCAQRLVRYVSKKLLSTTDSVALYVAHDNPAAAKVYRNVGFVGLDDSQPPVQGVDSWLEVGFDRAKVTLGHW